MDLGIVCGGGGTLEKIEKNYVRGRRPRQKLMIFLMFLSIHPCNTGSHIYRLENGTSSFGRWIEVEKTMQESKQHFGQTHIRFSPEDCIGWQ